MYGNFYLPWQIFSTAGTKNLSHTTARAMNRYSDTMTWITTAPSCLCFSVKKSLGKSSMAGGVQFDPKINNRHYQTCKNGK